MVRIFGSKPRDVGSIPSRSAKYIWREQPVRNRDYLLSRSFIFVDWGRNPASPQRLFNTAYVMGLVSN